MLKRFDEQSCEHPRSNTKTAEYLEELLPLFQAFPHVHQAILFGSRARGDQQDRSDIDFAIDAPKMDVLTWDELCRCISENSTTLLPVDLVWLQQAPTGLVERIQSEGVVVFEREDESIH